MDQASQLWVNELTRVSANLTVSIQQLQEAFQIRSDQSISEGGNAIPNPVSLLQRIAALEEAMSIIQNETQEVTTKKSQIVKKTCEILSNHFSKIRNLQSQANDKDTHFMGSELNENVKSIAQQCILFTQGTTDITLDSKQHNRSNVIRCSPQTTHHIEMPTNTHPSSKRSLFASPSFIRTQRTQSVTKTFTSRYSILSQQQIESIPMSIRRNCSAESLQELSCYLRSNRTAKITRFMIQRNTGINILSIRGKNMVAALLGLNLIKEVQENNEEITLMWKGK